MHFPALMACNAFDCLHKILPIACQSCGCFYFTKINKNLELSEVYGKQMWKKNIYLYISLHICICL